MTLLTIVQDACAEIGISAPLSVVGNSDNTTAQLLSLSNRGGKALAQRCEWRELTTEFTHTTVAAELQGTVESIMPGFNWDVYQTMWDRDQILPVRGPLSPQEWQALKAFTTTGPYSQFRFRGDSLYLIPAPAAGMVIAGEYISRNWCTGGDKWSADSDTAVLSEDLLTLDLIWRWKRAKGFDYAEERAEFEVQLNNAIARNGSKRTLCIDGTVGRTGQPGVYVPEGNWSV